MNKRSPTEWQILFEKYAASGLSAAAFCREQGLCPKYFSLRRKQLRDESSGTKQKPVLVPSRIKIKTQDKLNAFVPASIRPDVKDVIHIRLGELTVSLPMRVEAQWLSCLLLDLKA